MKILTTCCQCHANEQAAVLEIQNDNLHKVVCDYGHESFLVIAQQKHELLFEIGAQAIVDGYYREAISSFSSSLERYYEFFIRVILCGLSHEEFQKAWGSISSQSERQLGAYTFVYLCTFNKSPSLLSRKQVELRNKVVHKGHIPNRSQAFDFGVDVSAIIAAGYNLLRQYRSQEMDEVIRQAICPNDESGYPTKILNTYLNCMHSTELGLFEEHLNEIQTHNAPRY